MYHYIMGVVFILFYILLMYGIGYATSDKKQSAAYAFIKGYLIYSFFVALGGIPIQILNLPWIIFCIYMFLVLSFFLIYIMMKFKKKNIELNAQIIRDYLKNHYIMIGIVLFITIFSLTFISNIWMNNHMDDGFYLSKIGSLPYNDTFYTNFATGFKINLSDVGSYVFNTIEFEYAFYCQISNVSVSVFTKVFMALFNYFLFANIIFATGEIINRHTGNHIKKTWIQWTSVIIILLGISSVFAGSSYFFNVQDSWQFNSAMYYGSSIVRTFGILIIIIPFLEKEKITFKDISCVIAILFVLISKSSIALPYAFLIPYAYLMTHWLFSDNKKMITLAIASFIMLFVISLLIPNEIEIQNRIYSIMQLNYKSIYLLFSILIMLLSFSLRSKIINKTNVFMFIVLLLVCIDPLNNVFEKLSIYDFVGARFTTTYIYTILILGFIYLCIFCFKLLHAKTAKIGMLFVTICFTIITSYSSIKDNGNPINSFKTMIRNPHLVPNSTIQLSKVLNKLQSERNKDIYMAMPDTILADGYVHTPSVLIRTFSPNIYSISASRRYGYPSEKKFKGINDNFQKLLNQFLETPSNITFLQLENELKKFPINCIVTNDDKYEKYIHTMGFQLVEKTYDQRSNISYYIYFHPSK